MDDMITQTPISARVHCYFKMSYDVWLESQMCENYNGYKLEVDKAFPKDTILFGHFTIV